MFMQMKSHRRRQQNQPTRFEFELTATQFKVLEKEAADLGLGPSSLAEAVLAHLLDAGLNGASTRASKDAGS